MTLSQLVSEVVNAEQGSVHITVRRSPESAERRRKLAAKLAALSPAERAEAIRRLRAGRLVAK